MRSLIIVGAVVVTVSNIGWAEANPIPLDQPADQPISVTSEVVEITVHERTADIAGTYRFERDAPRSTSTDHILIYVPFCHDMRVSRDRLKTSAAASLTIEKRMFSPSYVVPGEALPELAPDLGMPYGWEMAYFVFDIPLRGVSREFTVSIRYTQQNLPSGSAPYYPVHPPKTRLATSVVRYSTTDSLRLIVISKDAKLIERSQTGVAFRPEDGKLLLVRAKKT